MMSDITVEPVLSPIVGPKVNPEAVKLDQRLQRYFYERPFAGVHEGAILELGIAPAEAVLGDSHIVLETDHGYCALDNYCTVFQALLGTPFAKLEREELARKLALLLPSVPREFSDLFGRITPHMNAKSSSSDYLLRGRLMAADCSVSFNMAAAETFWQRLLDNPSLSQRQVANASKKDVCPRVFVPLGEVTIKRKALSGLDVGDVLRLDNCLFDATGQGSIKLGADTLIVQWQSRGMTDNFSVTRRETGHAI